MTTNPPTILPKEPAKRPPLGPILITMLCSLVLAGGSCFAALRTLDASSNPGLSWWGFFMVVCLLAALTFVVACLWLIVQVVRISVQKKR